FGFDRGLGTLTYTIEPSGSLHKVDHDAFGRVAAIYSPSPDGSPGTTELAVRLIYYDKSPLSFVEVQRRLDIDSFATSYEIFNGLGENVLAYDQGDNVVDGAPWIQRDWIERDSSGRVSTRVRHSLFFDDPFTVADTAAPVSSSAGR